MIVRDELKSVLAQRFGGDESSLAPPVVVRVGWCGLVLRVEVACRGTAIAGPREGDAVKWKTHGVYKAVHSVLDELSHPAS